MTIDTRFALIAPGGDIRYPFKKRQLETGRFGFALSTAASRDKSGGGHYTEDIQEVIEHVVLHHGSVRARRIDGVAGNSIGLSKNKFKAYWVAPEFLHLVRGAAIAPLPELPTTGLIAHAPPTSEAKRTPFEIVEALTTDDFAAALEVVIPRATANQRAMLFGHASAPDHTLSMRAIAALGGYENHSSANAQFGKLGTLFATHFEVKGLDNQTQVMAFGGPRDPQDQWQWTLRPPLVEALE